MKKTLFLSVLTLILLFGFVVSSVAAGPPMPLSATFGKNATPCGLWWFDAKWKPVLIAGEGRLIYPADGGMVMTCHYTITFDDPTLLSRDAFCSNEGFAFMCRGDGGLVDTDTDCNTGRQVHNGTVAAGPSGEGMFVCHVK